MTAITPEQVIAPDSLESFEFEIICDIAGKKDIDPTWPACPGDAAQWVAWRANCCPESPKYRLICDQCKRTYQNWQAKQAFVYCGICGNETGGFISFTPLRGSS